MMQEKSILLYGLTATRGGLETYIRDFMDYCIDRKIRLGFIVKYDDVCFQDFILSQGWKIYKMPPRISNPVKFFRAFNEISKAEHYDILYMNILSAEEIYSALPAVFQGMKIIVHSHNNFSNTIVMHYLFRPILNLVAKKKIACSESAAFFMYGNGKAKIIKNAIDVKKFEFNREVRKVYRKKFGIDEKFVICHVGRISKQKNPSAIIDIIKGVYDADKEIILIYIGDGEEKEKIKTYTEGQGLKKAVLFLGERGDISELLSMSDLFILPSIYEGFGYVAIEAQASGLPTLISKAVPDDVMITEKCVKLPVPLKEKADYMKNIGIWVEEIKKNLKKEIFRRIDMQLFIKNGLDKGDKERYKQFDRIF